MTKPESRTLFITGATGGMGRACALLAAERGYNLLLSDLDNDKLRELAEECAEQGITATYRPLDVSDSAAIKQFADELKSAVQLDGIIHTLGLSPQMAAWDKIIQVDLIGTVELLEAVNAAALKSGAAAVCISSMSGHMIPPSAEIDALLAEPLSEDLLGRLAGLAGEPLANSGTAYAYAKKALVSYVQRQAMEWGRAGRRLVSISPGLIDTDMGRLEAQAEANNYPTMRRLVALQREGQPREIASAALFLVSDDASYISGCDLLVDGGFIGTFKNVQGQGESS